MRHMFLFIFVCTSIGGIECARVLGVFVMPAKSHHFLGDALMKGLADRGHDVVVISPFDENYQPKNGSFRTIHLSGFVEKREENRINLFEVIPGPIHHMIVLNMWGQQIVEAVFTHKNVKKFLAENNSFDVVIQEQFHVDALKGLAHYFKAPLVLFSTIGANAWVNFLSGNPAPPSYIPELTLSYTTSMTFLERVYNSLIYFLAEVNRQFIVFPSQNKLLQKYLPNSPHLNDLLYNASLFLLNSDNSVNFPVPKVPNMIDIGGFHIKSPKPLPKDLQTFMDNAKDGVILFSMGSNLKASQMSDSKKKAILKVFSELKQKVLWKFEDESLPSKLSNVEIRSWLPQQDILAHPNMKLFITHGGLLSTLEAIYHGVPLIAIPIFGDQKMNAATAVESGYAVLVNYDDLDENTLAKAINEILLNNKYEKNAKTRSKIMHDKPVKPMDAAAFWIEYVIRHKGATHLRVEGLNLAWYQYLLFDVVLFLGVLLVTILIILSFVVKILCCRKKKAIAKAKSN